ncbi:hypothetical protein [Microbacterium sp. zg-YB36]|uniref:LGFP repeat-containing protein n=1 Tax=Microbacterium sp. zg-YB36 TaxID=2969407 RepID=UPI00214AC654|nr:hypothetical protein [Microbacterium sp. zg-YB36]MDL5352569.1 hypothetical protein [Microbacterium sp. zg-YB36]
MSVREHPAPRRHIRIMSLLVAFIATIGLLVPLPSEPAAAADASDWDAGHIIDDQVFYDSNGMTATDVQTFLNGKVRTCADGYTCLKSYAQSTPTVAADSHCRGYVGNPRETAAQIIDNVARSCGINQRVLLVLLEKEQSLITATRPSAWSYQAATGQGCPDTAPCDPNTAGFFYQVYYAARQFQIYRATPNSWGYRAGRTNNILYSPTVSCGTKPVYIHNQATAALYIYTPYTPNDAALRNLYGTGDGCSAYGNRNFWRLFTDWFGDPRSFTVHPGFADYWNTQGGAGGSMGAPVSYAVYVENNGEGWYQRFERGTLYGSFWGGTVFIANGATLTEYNRQGGATGGLGFPNAPIACSSGSRCAQSFVAGSISSTAAYGAHAIWGGVNDHWRASGATDGSLGAALNDMAYLERPDGVAWIQHFERGVLAQSASGFHLTPYGALLDEWMSTGGASGWVGWPTTDYSCVADRCAQTFAGGVVTVDPTWGAHILSGSIAADWLRRGGLSSMGPAFNDMRTVSAGGGGWVQNFAAGILAQGTSGVRAIPYGAGQRLWSSSGSEAGPYGWPRTERSCTASGDCAQEFDGGVITESPAWGTYGVFGSIASSWRNGGGLATFGPALNSIRYSDANGGGWIQHYGAGILTQNSSGQPVFTQYGAILSMWYTYGGEITWLGWPAAAQTCDANGCTQQFQHGVARSDQRGYVSFTRE